MPYWRSAPGVEPPLWSSAAMKPPLPAICAAICSVSATMLSFPVTRVNPGRRGVPAPFRTLSYILQLGTVFAVSHRKGLIVDRHPRRPMVGAGVAMLGTGSARSYVMCLRSQANRTAAMASGWAPDGAVPDQIDDTVIDGVMRAR